MAMQSIHCRCHDNVMWFMVCYALANFSTWRMFSFSFNSLLWHQLANVAEMFIQSLNEVATKPPMDLPISKLIPPYCLAWRGSNKAVTLSFKRHRSSSI